MLFLAAQFSVPELLALAAAFGVPLTVSVAVRLVIHFRTAREQPPPTYDRF